MHLSSTPFKIHDENENTKTKTFLKGGRLGGLNNNNNIDGTSFKNHTVNKKNILLNSEIKSNRKALSNLSTSQVNIRSAQINTPFINNNNDNNIHTKKTLKFHTDINTKINPGITILDNEIEKTSSNSSITDSLIISNNLVKTEDDNNKIDFHEEDMICSHITDTEDPYDIVLKLSQSSTILKNRFQNIDSDMMHYDLTQSNNNDSNEYVWNDDIELISQLQESIDVQYSYDILLSNQNISNEIDLKLMDLTEL